MNGFAERKAAESRRARIPEAVRANLEETNRRNGGYVPQDWHAAHQRDVAEENRSNMRELPMGNPSPSDEIAETSAGDILSNRSPGTTEALFNLQGSSEEFYTNCVMAENESEKTPAENGIRGIECLIKKSLEALNVSLNESED